jgi:hypothetical protein
VTASFLELVGTCGAAEAAPLQGKIKSRLFPAACEAVALGKTLISL